MEIKRLTTCYNAAEAYLIKGRLLNEDIKCFLTNENITNLLPHLNNTLDSGIQIFVNENDFQKANEIIQNSNSQQQMICPICGSKDIRIGIGKRKGLRILNIILSLLVFVPFRNMKPKYHCNECKSEF